jgi:alkylated DNA repair protein alkB homolog 1
LTAIYGAISDLLIAAKKQKILVEVNSPDSQETNEQDKIGENTQPINFKFMDDSKFPKGEVCKSIAATILVRKLRWCTLGLQFDWSKVCSLLLPWKCYYFFTFIFLMVLILCRQGIGLFR